MPAVVIPGRPVAKGRPRVGAAGNVYTPKTTRDYEERIAWLVRASRGRVDGPCEVFITVFARGNRPDIDNVAKIILDGLQKGSGIANDRDVVDLRVRVFQAESGQERVEVVWDKALPEAA